MEGNGRTVENGRNWHSDSDNSEYGSTDGRASEGRDKQIKEIYLCETEHQGTATGEVKRFKYIEWLTCRGPPRAVKM